MQEKIYYNQQNVINHIADRTGCSPTVVGRILSELGDMVKDKFSDRDKLVEIKIFPGLKVTAEYIPSEQSGINLCNFGFINSNEILKLRASFTSDFKNQIRTMHKEIYS